MIGAILLMAMVPCTPVSLACGLLFGASVRGRLRDGDHPDRRRRSLFAAGRWLGRDFVAHHLDRASSSGRLRRQWVRLEGWITKEGVLAVSAIRSLPIGPYRTALKLATYGTSGIRGLATTASAR